MPRLVLGDASSIIGKPPSGRSRPPRARRVARAGARMGRTRRSSWASGRGALLILAGLAGQTPAVAAAAAGDDLIAFCRPGGGTAHPAEAPCICSVEGVEVAVTPGRFILHVRDRRTAGMASAAELRAAVRHARDVCGAGATAGSLEALGAPLPDGAGPSPIVGRQAGSALPVRAGAP